MEPHLFAPPRNSSVSKVIYLKWKCRKCNDTIWKDEKTRVTPQSVIFTHMCGGFRIDILRLRGSVEEPQPNCIVMPSCGCGWSHYAYIYIYIFAMRSGAPYRWTQHINVCARIWFAIGPQEAVECLGAEFGLFGCDCKWVCKFVR